MTTGTRQDDRDYSHRSHVGGGGWITIGHPFLMENYNSTLTDVKEEEIRDDSQKRMLLVLARGIFGGILVPCDGLSA